MAARGVLTVYGVGAEHDDRGGCDLVDEGGDAGGGAEVGHDGAVELAYGDEGGAVDAAGDGLDDRCVGDVCKLDRATAAALCVRMGRFIFENIFSSRNMISARAPAMLGAPCTEPSVTLLCS